MPETPVSPSTRGAFFIATAAGLTSSVQPLLEDGNALLQFIPNYAQPPAELTREVRIQLRKLGPHIQLLETKENSLTQTLTEWQAFITAGGKSVTPEDSAQYAAMATNPQGLLQTAEVVQQMLTQLRFHREDLEVLLSRLDESNANIQPPINSTVSLDRSVQLPKFEGGATEFAEFWPLFEALVDHTTLPDIVKVSILSNALRGQAAEVIKGYSLIPQNYSLIKQALQDAYGDEEEMRAQLRNQLRALRTTDHWQDLKAFVTNCERILRQLATAQEAVETPFIYDLITSKLPPNIRFLLAQEKRHSPTWTTKEICTALKDIAQMKKDASPYFQPTPAHRSSEGHGPSSPHFNHGQAPSSQRPLFPTPGRASAPSLSARYESHPRRFPETPRLPFHPQSRTSAPRPLGLHQRPSLIHCAFCSGRHLSNYCPTYTTLEQKRRRIAELNLCRKCLRPGHLASVCTRKPCPRCNGPHDSILCSLPATPNLRTTTIATTAPAETPSREHNSMIAAAVPTQTSIKPVSHLSDEPVAVSPCCKLTVFNPQDPSRTMQVTAFFDSGAQGSYLTERVREQLHLSSIERNKITFKGIAGFRGTTHSSDRVQLGVLLPTGAIHTIDTHTLTTVTENLLHADITEKHRNLLLTNDNPILPIPLVDREPDLVVGSNFHYIANPTSIKQLRSGFHLLTSQAGPMLGGQGHVSEEYRRKPHQAYTLVVCPAQHQEADFWSLETLGIDAKGEQQEDDEIAQDLFSKSVSRNADGRYSVSFPWKRDLPRLATNFSLALGRLQSVLKKFQADQNLLKAYTEVFVKQLELGIIEETPECPHAPICTYLPHQPVLRANHATTKLRVVYDASAGPKGHSLNDCLYRGPILLPDLAGLLLRLRLHPIVMVADIEKAFLQVGLHPADRDATRFLWVHNPSEPVGPSNPPIIYRFTRIPFGIISSPFLLQSVIRYHLNQQDTPLAQEMKMNTYVDNILITANDDQQAIERYRQAKEIFSQACMNLRDFAANHETIIKNIDPTDRHNEANVKVLGLQWSTNQDTLTLSTNPFKAPAITRRTLLSFIHSHFDPLGLLTPVLLPLKIFHQDLTRTNLSWDAPIPQPLRSHISEALKAWKAEEISLSRFVGHGTTSFHVFTDASERAYACTVYVRQEADSNVQTSLLFSKTRLCPISGLSIQRLELLGVLIGVRALNFVTTQLQLQTSPLYLWSDSKCSLAWVLHSNDDKLPRFVKNRVTEIRRYSNIRYAYVKSADNPADIATRGTSINLLRNNSLWFHGPSWLQTSSTEWPSDNVSISSLSKSVCADDAGPLQHFNAFLIKHTRPPPITLVDVTRFSSLNKAVTTVAWVLRYLHRIAPSRLKCLPATTNKGPFLGSDHRIALQLLIRQEQTRVTSEDINKWNLVLDDNLIWRCHGRLSEASIPMNRKFPIFLPRDSHLTQLLVLQAHSALMHAGVAATLTQIRHKYWIPQGKSKVQGIISRHCHGCSRWKAKPFALPIMPTLPDTRVQVGRPFQHTATDYFGPMKIKTEAGTSKRWVALFTCMVTRAIHLELAESLSAESFLHCYRRFVSRRGKPETLLSDNGTNFLLASKALKLAQRQLAESGTQWQFVTQISPWKGGVYERLVGLTKNALRRAIGRRLLTETDLITYLTEAEAVINQRPLTALHSDSLEVLRPADFLTPDADSTLDPGEPNTDEYRPEALSTREALLEQWKQSRCNLSRFWQLWSSAYLQFLRERTQREHTGPRNLTRRAPQKGELVILRDDNHPRSIWKLAIIEETCPGNDGHIRTAKVRIPNGHILLRPISVLFPLELNNPQVTADQHSEKTASPTVDSDQSNEEDSTPPPRSSGRHRHGAHRKARLHSTQIRPTSSIFYVVLITLLLPLTLGALRTQICPHKHSGVYVHFPQTRNCSTIPSGNWQARDVNIFRRKVVNVPAIYCSKVVRTICTWAFLRLSLQMTSDTHQSFPIKAEHCRQIALHKHTGSLPLKPTTTPNVWSTQIPPSSSYNLFGTHCTPTTNYIVEFGSVAFLSGSQPLSRHSRTAGCHSRDNQCFTPHETIVWNISTFDQACHYTLLGTYPAHLSPHEIVVDKLQATFRVQGRPPNSIVFHCDFPPSSLQAVNDYIIVPGDCPRLTEEANDTTGRSFLQEHVSETDPENPKLQYLFDVESQRAAVRWCSLRNLFITLLRQMSMKNPTAAIRIMLGRNDIAARYIGDSLLITRCYSFKPKIIHEDHRLADKCYELLPVEMDNQLLFITPLDHDLVAQSAEVPCPWTPPKITSKNETLDILSENYEAMTVFTAAKLPDAEIDMMNLALDHAENMEMLAPAKKLNREYMSAVEEFLWEIGADVEAGTRELQEELEGIAHKWRWITGGTVILIVIAVSAILWWKCHDRRKRLETSQVVINLRELKPEGRTRRVASYSPIAVPDSVFGC